MELTHHGPVYQSLGTWLSRLEKPGASRATDISVFAPDLHAAYTPPRTHVRDGVVIVYPVCHSVLSVLSVLSVVAT